MATKTPKIRFSRFDAAWEQRKLGDIATLINGRAFSQNELLEQGKYPILRVGNFYTNGSWYFSNMKLEEKFYAARGDLLYTWSASFGPHIWEGEKVIFHYHIWKIELTEKLDKQFALFLLDKDKDNLLSGSNGSTMIHITKSGMEEKKLWIPKDKTEQKKIGTFLKKLEETITLHQKKLEHFKKLKESLLQNMFPREGEIFPRLRFPEFTDAWEQCKFGELVKRISGSALSSPENPGVEYDDINSGEGTLNKDVRLKVGTKKGQPFEPADLLYGKLRPYLKNILLPDFSGVAIGDFWVLRPAKYSSKFLFNLIQTPRFEEKANCSAGSKMPR
uniref:restriction endonuclease subunit S n=3 Tax=Turicimonas muris TaxID=1796652 RepID=UPI00261FB49F